MMAVLCIVWTGLLHGGGVFIWYLHIYMDVVRRICLHTWWRFIEYMVHYCRAYMLFIHCLFGIVKVDMCLGSPGCPD